MAIDAHNEGPHTLSERLSDAMGDAGIFLTAAFMEGVNLAGRVQRGVEELHARFTDNVAPVALNGAHVEVTTIPEVEMPAPQEQ